MDTTLEANPIIGRIREYEEETKELLKDYTYE
jgi:hypothetical protein